MIELRGVRKVFRQGDAEVQALAGVSLDVAHREFVAVVGPSGSGKTTLLNVIGGLEPPTAGDVSIDGRSLGGMRDDERTIFRRRHIGLVFQFFNLLPTLTAEENVALPLVLDGVARQRAAAQARAALVSVGLERRATHRPEELSGGEMQRVAIARALVVEPKVMLADEPTGNLDSHTREQVLDLLSGIHADRGTTVVLVTHAESAAERASRVIEMRDGAVVNGAAA